MTNIVFKKLKTKESELYSFDIFDTLITRRTATPLGIFAIMQKILQEDLKYQTFPQILKNNFYEIRIEAERYVRDYNFRVLDNQDVNIYEIYNQIEKNYSLNNAQIEAIISLEFETELKNIVPIERNIKLLKNLCGQGKRVVLISDMYLPKDVIRTMLMSVDNIFRDIEIYVSNEYTKTKHYSDLYNVVKEKEKIEFLDWQHFGDNLYADVKNSQKLGIIANFLEAETLLPYEQMAISSQNDFHKEFLIGTSKISRLINKNASPTYKLASSFAAPILYCYVSWLINQSLNKGVKTLYFVARDGYVLKIIADEIIRLEKLAIKTKYIYGSRKAWRIPNENNIKDFISWNLNEYVERMSLEFLSKRFSIPIEDLTFYSDIKNYKKVLNKKERKQLEKDLLNNKGFINKLVEINREKQNLLVEYLEQEIDFSEKKIVFVDIFGSGRTQDLLASIIKTKYDVNVSTYYFNRIPDQKENEVSEKICYYATVKNYHYGIELLCRNKEGQTLGYKKVDNKIIPVLEKVDTSLLTKWGYEDYLEGLKAYTEIITGTKRHNDIEISGIDLYKDYLNYFLNNLDKETADVIGSIPYSDVGAENNSECAPKFSFSFVLKLLFRKKKYASNLPLSFISAKRSAKIFGYLLCKKNNETLLQRIFSVRNSDDKMYKIITIFGIKWKRERKI